MIPESIRQLIMNAEMNKVAEDFWKEIERLAAEKEVTVEYFLAEFYQP